MTVVMVTHEPDIAAQAERLIELVDGEVARDVEQRPAGTPNGVTG